ncbi:sirohydrochlorin chelatase [Actinomadura kijaniata]|uniref:Sirohydrochlorin ferrochelatase n=1 Tax=Actinomadura namibiensis TaxID=182080 RepID=A0A7W3LRI4_ACTNM|nr:sirohydrochlorin chelatase [Actinomadura namibiensis]MBA8952875.1 sirohydrochlorin ferrochelatase [Actinomadura namibiensis]
MAELTSGPMRGGYAPTLVAVAHGTRRPGGPETVRALLERVRRLRPWLNVVEAYAEISEPVLEEAVAGLDGPVVAVPLLLARGYHALVDIPGRLERVHPHAVTARPLGPHALLTATLADHLGPLRSSDAVVLGAAGSSDPAGVADVRTAARLLARRLRRPVPYGFVAAEGPRLAEVVAERRRRGAPRVKVASYLLAPGLFHERMLEAGADAVTPPLGAHDALARLVLRRFDEAWLRHAAAIPAA